MSDARQVEAFEAALARADTPDAAYVALERLARDTVGVRLFTVMTLDMAAMLARRAYTSHPAEYPTSGTKPIERNPWFAQVADRREPFVANSWRTSREVFPDHALIGSLGCGAVINLPVGGGQGDAARSTFSTPRAATRRTSPHGQRRCCAPGGGGLAWPVACRERALEEH